METPTIVRQTKDYLLVKIPLPKRDNLKVQPVFQKPKISAAERRLWQIIQQGEREYREGKTIHALSVDEALKIYEKRKNRD